MWEPEDEPAWLAEQRWTHPDEPWDDSDCGPEYWMYRDFGLPPYRGNWPWKTIPVEFTPDDIEEL